MCVVARRFVVDSLVCNNSPSEQNLAPDNSAMTTNHQHLASKLPLKKTKLENPENLPLPGPSILQKEIQFCDKIAQGCASDSWQAKLAKNHMTWLKNSFG